MIVITSTGLRIDTARRYCRAAEVRKQAAEADGRQTAGPVHRRLAEGESVTRVGRLTAGGSRRSTVLCPRT